MISERYKVITLSILFVFLWSSGWIGSKFALGYAGTFSLLMWRYLFVVATLLVLVSLLKAWRPIDKSQLLSHALVGVLSHAVYLSTSLSSMNLGVSVGLVAFVLALQPLLTAAISSPFTGEIVNQRQWVGLGLGLLAVLLVVGDRLSLGGSWIAYSLLLLSIFGITLATLIHRKLEITSQQKKRPPIPILLVLLIHCSATALFLIPLAAYFEGFQVKWERPLLFAIIWLGWVVTLSAYGLMFVLLRMIPTTKVSCLMYLSPPTTMLIAYFAFDEKLIMVDVIGLIIASIAVWIVSAQHTEITTERKTVPPKGRIVE